MACVKDPQVSTLKTIEAAIKLVDTKKENLKKAFDDLQAHSFLSPSLPISWSDIDSHFSSIHNTLTRRFQVLQSGESSSSQSGDPPPVHDLGASNQSLVVVSGDPSPSFIPLGHDRVDPDVGPSVERDGASVPEPPSSSNPAGQAGVNPVQSELIAFCEKMDGKGLRNYVHDHPHKRDTIRVELQDAMRAALDQGTLVLDALEEFYGSNSSLNGDKDLKLSSLRRTCIDLLETVIRNKPNLSDEVRERAKGLALEWKGKVRKDGDPLEALGFLNLLVAYQLQNEFDVSELVDFFVVVARFKQAAVLCRAIGLGEKTAEFVQKLIDNGKEFLAVKFIFEFGMADQFQPIPFLKAHLKVAKNFTNKVCNDGKSSIKTQNEARSREINALKSVLKIVDEHNLGSEYPRVDLEKRIEMLDKQKPGMKRPAEAAPSADSQPPAKKQVKKQPKKQGKRPQHTVSRHARPAGVSSPAVNVGGAGPSVPPFQQSYLQPAGLLPGVGMYGLVGSIPTPPMASYGGSSADRGYPGNPSPHGEQLYYTQQQVPPGYYDRPVSYGGYGLPPQYHAEYYPR